ncbi:unnamed protein product [Absidia cylindrospora]
MFALDSIKKSKLPVISIAAASTLFVLYAIVKRTTRSTRKLKQGEIPIPFPDAGFPIIGQLLSLGSVPILQISKWQEALGPLLRLKMGKQQWIMISDPFIGHDIFMTHGAKTSGRPTGSYGYDIYAYNGRGIVFADNTKKWKNTRTAVLSILAQNKVDEYGDVLSFEADALIDSLVQNNKNGEEPDINPMKMVHWAAYNCIMRTCFSTRASSPDDPLFLETLDFIDQGGKYAGAFGYLGTFFPWLTWFDKLAQKTEKMQHFVSSYRDRIFNKLIADSLQQENDCLAKGLHKLMDEFELDDLDILVTMSDLIVAGTDTISVSIRWAFAILTHHMDVQDKICKELDAFITTYQRLPSFADREHLPYMTSVQRECMRYRPTVPFNAPHVVNEDFDYKGYHFCEGDILLSNMYLMHKNSNAYSQPDSFTPERFLHLGNKTMMGSAAGNIQQRDHYNFGWGRRICPGIYLAETQIFNVFVKLFAQYKIHPAKNGKYPDLNKFVDAGIVLMPEEYSVRFIQREDAVLV